MRSGDGVDFGPGKCDGILINAGVTHRHPRSLECLNEGGNLAPLAVSFGMGMGANLGNGVMARIVREENGFSARVVSFVAIYSSLGLRDARLEQALGRAMRTGTLFKLRSLRRDVHELADTCLVHSAQACLSSSETSTSFAA